MFGSLVNRAIAHNLAHKWQLLGGVLQRRQLGRGRQMRTRQVETFSLRKLQQPSPGLATLLLPPTQDSGHLPRRTVHRTISRNLTVHRHEIGRLVIKDHDHDQPAIVVFASVSKFHIFLYLTACVKAPGPSPSPSIGKFRPIDSSTASPGHSRDFRVSFIDTVTTLHCCCRCWQRFYNYLKYLMAPLVVYFGRKF